MKVNKVKWGENEIRYVMYCESCKTHHFADDRWSFNGDYDKPTFSPSLLVTNGHQPTDICHSFVRDGKWEYLGDCTHDMAGKTVDMVDSEWE